MIDINISFNVFASFMSDNQYATPAIFLIVGGIIIYLLAFISIILKSAPMMALLTIFAALFSIVI